MNHNHPPTPEVFAETPTGEPGDEISRLEADALDARLDAARDSAGHINHHDARTIAACLCDYIGAGRHSALHHFASTGEIKGSTLSSDSLTAHISADLPPTLRRWTAWLTTYTAQELPLDDIGWPVPRNGDALDAFLGLPDLDHTSDSLLTDFRRAYCGSFDDIDAVIEGVSDALEWEDKIHSLATELGCSEFVSVDREAIERRIRDGWDVIPNHGRLHVFFR
ncbi:hypothetical protein [Mycobacteroides abscessus]|uniref:hypothetical protein n=1 Tax=Mycobacteroides abscessus TaxID=36809 RepID=UPI0009A69E6D|nr:hypothetical protein [Mycobacteroides abscessus]RIT44597.1 hypothetical protein D2E80_19695 [Mycobacteroides abscessus]SKT78805.1 Uncharacterised protein [Mycobacteroides abscessus subsp. massiliense]SKU03048.1 Uncharacterised protein [Mycobacteroides abscessus subsp. massiliense]